MRGSTWLVGLVVAVGLLAAPATGAAHAGLRSSEPAAGAVLADVPASVRLALSSAVEERFLLLRVTGPDGRTVSAQGRRDPRDPRAVLAPLGGGGPGAYTVAWRVLSRDGHPSGGVFAFGVGAPAAAAVGSPVRPDHGPLALIARLLALVGPLGLVGLVALAAGVVGPAVRAGGIVVPGEGAPRAAAFREGARRALTPSATGWWRAWWALTAAWAAGLALSPAALLWSLREGPGSLDDLRAARVGDALLTQATGLVALVVVSVVVARAVAPAGLPESPRLAALLGVGPLAALWAISWGGHASSAGDGLLDIAIDFLHNVATAVWIGGLLGLAVLVSPAVARLGDDDRVRLAAAVVVRFSALAMVSVAVLVVTGVYRALAEVSVGDLVDTGYGRALLVKLALFALLLAGGAYNRAVVHPRLERAALGLAADDRGAAAALRVSVRAELAVAALLLGSVAVLVSLPPPG